MESSDVYVVNMSDYSSELSDLISRLDSIDTVLSRIVGYSYDILVYLRVIVWIIGVLISFRIAIWFYRAFIRSYVRQYFKFNINF